MIRYSLSRPWLHFLVLGALLHLGMSVAFPEPLPQLGPPAAGRLQLLGDNFFELTRRRPTEKEWQALIDRELREELLFREAIDQGIHLRDSAVTQRLILNMRFLAPSSPLSDNALALKGLELRMHLTDEVIRRRLVQVMERLLAASAAIPPPSDAVVSERWRVNQADYWLPEKYSFSQVFLPAERATERDNIGTALASTDVSPLQARHMGGPFLAGFDFEARSLAQLRRQFGEQFVSAFAEIDKLPQTWIGPIASAYGLHWLYIKEVAPARLRDLDEVRAAIERSWRAEQESAAVDAAVARLMTHYEVRRS